MFYPHIFLFFLKETIAHLFFFFSDVRLYRAWGECDGMRGQTYREFNRKGKRGWQQALVLLCSIPEGRFSQIRVSMFWTGRREMELPIKSVRVYTSPVVFTVFTPSIRRVLSNKIKEKKVRTPAWTYKHHFRMGGFLDKRTCIYHI